MIAKIILMALLMLIVLYAYTQRRRSFFVFLSVTAIGGLGIFFVLFPQITTVFAHSVGIGRGADLVLYSFIVATLLAVLNLHLHLRGLKENITENTRQITLLEARLKERDNR